MALKYRDVLLALSYRYEGDWEKTFSWIKQKLEQPSIEEVQNAYMALKSFFVDPLDESLSNHTAPAASPEYDNIILFRYHTLWTRRN